MTRIQGPTTPPVGGIADFELPTTGAGGGLEQTIQQAAARLEESSDRSRSASRESSRQRTAARREALGVKRDAARTRLIAGVMSGCASAASTGLTASGDKTGAGLTDATAKAVDAGLQFRATNMDLNAEGLGITADGFAEAAESDREHSDRATRLADRAQGHLDEIARASHEARMAALRG